MTQRRTILPPNATQLERSFDAAVPQWDAIAAQVEPVELRQNDSMLPWMVAHWQLSQFDRYFADPRELLANGLPWLRERGSAVAVKRAMGWLGYEGVKIEEEGARLHINPGREVTTADMRQIAHVVRASIPLHVQFYRVFYNLDLRMLRWDSRKGWDSALWDSHSGTPVDLGDGTEVIGSQGSTKSTMAPAPLLAPVQAAGAQCSAGVARRPDTMRWDAWRWDSSVQQMPSAAGIAMLAGIAPAYIQLQALSATAEGMATLAPSERGMASGAGALLGSSMAPYRFNDSRTWVGGWDASPWQQVTAQSDHKEME
jgi:hypothetical protein